MTVRLLLTALPFVGLLVGIFPANRVEPFVLGLPFVLFWVTLWVLLTAAIMGIVALLDDGSDEREEQP